MISDFEHRRFTQGYGDTVQIQDGFMQQSVNLCDGRGRDETVDSYAERCWLFVATLVERIDLMDQKFEEMERRLQESQAVAISLDGQVQELRRGMEEIGVIEGPVMDTEEPQQG